MLHTCLLTRRSACAKARSDSSSCAPHGHRRGWWSCFRSDGFGKGQTACKNARAQFGLCTREPQCATARDICGHRPDPPCATASRGWPVRVLSICGAQSVLNIRCDPLWLGKDTAIGVANSDAAFRCRRHQRRSEREGLEHLCSFELCRPPVWRGRQFSPSVLPVTATVAKRHSGVIS